MCIASTYYRGAQGNTHSHTHAHTLQAHERENACENASVMMCLFLSVSSAIIVVFDLSSVGSLIHARYEKPAQAGSFTWIILHHNPVCNKVMLGVGGLLCVSVQAVAGRCYEGERPLKCALVSGWNQEGPQCELPMKNNPRIDSTKMAIIHLKSQCIFLSQSPDQLE